MDRFVAHIGIPRTDLFFGAERRRATVEAVRRLYRLPDGKKVILYAPTFRGARVDEAHHHEELDLAHLRDVIGDDHVLLLRAHPFVRSWTVADPSMQEFAIDVSDHKDIQELMLVADLLITDYSSVIFEYSLLRRPIVFYAPDHQAYQRERGFYLDFPRDLPGPVFDTTDALAAHLRAEQFDLEAIDRFSRSSFDVADGHASQRFVDEVVVPALGDRR